MDGRSDLRRGLLIWGFINLGLSLLIASIISAASEFPFSLTVPVSLFYTYTISGLSAGAGHYFGKYKVNRSLRTRVMRGVPASLVGMSLALAICVYLTPPLFGEEIGAQALPVLRKMIPAIVLLSVMLALASAYIQGLRTPGSGTRTSKTDATSDAKSDTTAPPDDPGPARFHLKERENEHVLELDDIVFLSSHGRRTTIHTRAESIVVSRLLKELEESLPAERFLRIHKQYLINVGFLIRLRHESGGRYRVHLKDEDATALPVGRSYLTALRRRMPG